MSPRDVSFNLFCKHETRRASAAPRWIRRFRCAAFAVYNSVGLRRAAIHGRTLDPHLTRRDGAAVSGLTGSDLVLQSASGNNATSSLTISSNGSFAFAPRVANGTSYSVSIESQPVNPAQICTVSNGSGTL